MHAALADSTSSVKKPFAVVSQEGRTGIAQHSLASTTTMLLILLYCCAVLLYNIALQVHDRCTDDLMSSSCSQSTVCSLLTTMYHIQAWMQDELLTMIQRWLHSRYSVCCFVVLPSWSWGLFTVILSILFTKLSVHITCDQGTCIPPKDEIVSAGFG